MDGSHTTSKGYHKLAKGWYDAVEAHQRAQNEQVAEKVMGWHWHDLGWMKVMVPPEGTPGIVTSWSDNALPPVPNFTTDAGADYTVLEHVRAEWIKPPFLITMFWMELDHLWQGREAGGYPMAPFMYYHPGDYSHAALATIERSDGVLAEVEAQNDDERSEGEPR
jgi:hypothetical protein